jgi:hypothetical protein
MLENTILTLAYHLLFRRNNRSSYAMQLLRAAEKIKRKQDPWNK